MFSSPDLWKEFFETYYRDEINRLADQQQDGTKPTLFVNVRKDLIRFKEMRLMEELFEQPERVMADAEEGLKLADNVHGVELEGRVRFHSLPKSRILTIRGLRSSHISRFVAVEGIVRSVSSIVPKITVAAFRCNYCESLSRVEQDKSPFAKLRKPAKCPCGRRSFTFIPELSERVDSQRIRIQEYPENLRAGEQPGIVDVVLDEDLVGSVFPGDRITVNGVVKALYRDATMPKEVYIVANSVEVREREYEEVKVSREEEKAIIELSKRPDIYDLFIKSICPAVVGYEEIKLAIALQLFGGLAVQLPDGTKIRGDIHVLLVGDPGCAKSKLLKYVHDIAPRSVMVTGKGASGVGLTASVVRDADGRWMVDAGAMVLADKGLVCADEFEKMSRDDREFVHSAMEDQFIAINKAGLNMVLPTRCSVLAAANPKHGRFDRYAPLAEQVDFDPALLTRFDLIFLILDEPGERDKAIAEHILTKIFEPEEIRGEISPEMLRKYVAYARRKVRRVEIDERARARLMEFYLKMREAGKGCGAIPITARQLESLTRLAIASAKLRLSERVTVEDVERVIKIVRKSLEQIAVDPETGNIDVDYAFTGVSKTMRDRILLIRKIIEELQFTTDKGAREEDVLSRAEAEGIEPHKALEILRKLKERGEIYSPRYGYYMLAG